MMEVEYKWGANYLVSDDDTCAEPKRLCTEKDTINPGDKITGFGSKRRTEFTLKKGCFMTYEGIVNVSGLDYAVFKCSEWDLVDDKQYRYAFNPVMQNGILTAFLQGSENGMRDIDVTTINFFKP